MNSEHSENTGLSDSERWDDWDDRQIIKRQLIELAEEILYIAKKRLERRLLNQSNAPGKSKSKASSAENQPL